jgi:anaerobic sulfite reductase subunit C
MNWTAEADAAIKKVPFFVRKRVRTRVEEEARKAGKKEVSLADVKATQGRYLKNMSREIKGYQIDTCFGPGGCPKRAVIGDALLEKIEALLRSENLLGFLKERVGGDLKFHHEFRVTLADCPNACSQPQIKDIGIIGASLPAFSSEVCTLCDACVDTCKEAAVTLQGDAEKPEIDFRRCVACGQCMAVCPSGTLVEGKKGYRVQLGGKLGRHPRLARELPGIFSEAEVLQIVKECITFYKQHSKRGERFALLFTEKDFEEMAKRHASG